jgi:hypothetical protein
MKIKDERDKLEQLLRTSSETINDDVPIPGKIPEELKVEPLIGLNFEVLKEACNDEARIMLNNSIGFILTPESIIGNDYVKNKLEVDIMSLGGMIYQLRANEAMQKALMNEVDRGMINPRMFEVFSGLSKTIADINKQLLGTVEAIKSTYKDIKNDIREKATDALGPHQDDNGMITQGDGGVVTLGTKELINQMKNRARTENIQDIEEIK